MGILSVFVPKTILCKETIKIFFLFYLQKTAGGGGGFGGGIGGGSGGGFGGGGGGGFGGGIGGGIGGGKFLYLLMIL